MASALIGNIVMWAVFKDGKQYTHERATIGAALDDAMAENACGILSADFVHGSDNRWLMAKVSLFTGYEIKAID